MYKIIDWNTDERSTKKCSGRIGDPLTFIFHCKFSNVRCLRKMKPCVHINQNSIKKKWPLLSSREKKKYRIPFEALTIAANTICIYFAKIYINSESYSCGRQKIIQIACCMCVYWPFKPNDNIKFEMVKLSNLHTCVFFSVYERVDQIDL